MKCICFLWSLLVYHNIGFLLSRGISITRKAKLPQPGSSPDEFIIYSSQCLAGKKCEEFGAFQANRNTANDDHSQNCLCVCKPGRETLFYQDKSWKCLDDNTVRNRTGSVLLFQNQNSSSGLFTFGVGQWTYFSNLMTSLGRCKINSASSKYLQCNGSWASLPPTRFIFLLIQDGNQYFRFQVNSIDGLQGRLIKLVINCARSPWDHCVAFKIEGGLKCPEIDILNSTLVKFTESILPISLTTKKSPDPMPSSITIKPSSTYTARKTKLLLYTVEKNSFFHKAVSLYQTLSPMTSSSARLLSSRAIGNITEKKEITLNNAKTGISVAVLATAVATAFLFGMLLISALMLRKKMFVKKKIIMDRKRKNGNPTASEPENRLSQELSAAATSKSEIEEEVAVYAQIDSGIAVEAKKPPSSTALPNYECIWSEDCGSGGYQNLSTEEGNEMDVHSLQATSLRQCSMPENRRKLGKMQNCGCAKNNKHSKKKSPIILKRAGDHDSLNHDEVTPVCKETECSQCGYKCHPLDTGSVVQLSTTMEGKCERLESPLYDNIILEGRNSNLDLPIRMVENRVYGKIEELTPKDAR